MSVGLKPGVHTVVAARPLVGKTSVASCLGPTAIEAELRQAVIRAGGVVFKLEIDDSSILLSFDVVPGNAKTRKCNYVRYATGLLLGAFEEMRDWIGRV